MVILHSYVTVYQRVFHYRNCQPTHDHHISSYPLTSAGARAEMIEVSGSNQAILRFGSWTSTVLGNCVQNTQMTTIDAKHHDIFAQNLSHQKKTVQTSANIYVLHHLLASMCVVRPPPSRHVRVHVAVHVAVHVRDHVKDMAHNKPK